MGDVNPRFALIMEWDTAVGQATFNGVGLEVIDKAFNDNMRYNRAIGSIILIDEVTNETVAAGMIV